jgi:hypothetical protein
MNLELDRLVSGAHDGENERGDSMKELLLLAALLAQAKRRFRFGPA